MKASASATTVHNDNARPGETLKSRVASLIREKSAAAALVAESEIVIALKSDPPGAGGDIAAVLAQLIKEDSDLHEITGTVSRCYYSSEHMTASYARVLFHKREGPPLLIAETVRESAAATRQPMPLGIFSIPPFSLTHRQIIRALASIAAADDYRDIAMVRTTVLGTYLYSTNHLEPEYAEMLAEWLDVGQFNNP